MRFVCGYFGKSGCATTFAASAVGSGSEMAKVIEYYVPDKFRKIGKWIPPSLRGKVIRFPEAQKKTA